MARLENSTGRRDAYTIKPEDLLIEQEDPKHPEHWIHAARVHPENAAFQRIVNSFRLAGWTDSSVVLLATRKRSREAGGNYDYVAAGKRRVTALRIVNAERAKEGLEPYDVLAIKVPDGDTAERMENSYREDDALVVRARRFLRAKVSCSSETEAAAQCGFTLREAREAVELLSADPELLELLTARRVSADVALRIMRKGLYAAQEQLDAARGADGKVDPSKLRSAAQHVSPEAIAAGKAQFEEAEDARLQTILNGGSENGSEGKADAGDEEEETAGDGGAETAVAPPAATGGKKVRLPPAKRVLEMRKALHKTSPTGNAAVALAVLDFLLGKKKALNEYPKIKSALLGEEES